MPTIPQRRITYGIGGHDESKPNNNIIEDVEEMVEVPDPPAVDAVRLRAADGSEHEVTVDAAGKLRTRKDKPARGDGAAPPE